MSYSEIKFFLADKNAAGAGDSDNLIIYRNVGSDPLDASGTLKGTASSFTLASPSGDAVLEWIDATTAPDTPYFYRFVSQRLSDSSMSAPSDLVGPLMLQGEYTFGRPFNVPSHESGVPNFLDVEPWIHIDAIYEEAARGNGYEYADVPDPDITLRNLSKRSNYINFKSGGSTSFTRHCVIDYVDHAGTNHNIPIISRAADGTSSLQRTGSTPSGIDFQSFIGFDEGVTIAQVSAFTCRNKDGSLSEVGTGSMDQICNIGGGSHTGSTRYQKYSNFKARQSDPSLPIEYMISGLYKWQEEEIQAGRMTRSVSTPGLPVNSDPNDQANAVARSFNFPTYYSSIGGLLYRGAPSFYNNGNIALPNVYKKTVNTDGKLNLYIHRLTPELDHVWYWNGYKVGEHTRNNRGYFTYDSSGYSYDVDCPNWTHWAGDKRFTFFPHPIMAQGSGHRYMNMGNGVAEYLIIPKALSGEMMLRLISYLQGKWGPYLADQGGHLGL